MSVKLVRKTETVYVARCQWAVGKDVEGNDIVGFGLLWERKGYDDAATIVDVLATQQYGDAGRFYHTWLEQVTRYDDGSEEASIVREHNRPQEIKSAMERVLSGHVGHEVSVSGAAGSAIRMVEPLTTLENAQWWYGGFVVHCLTCDQPLSDQW